MSSVDPILLVAALLCFGGSALFVSGMITQREVAAFCIMANTLNLAVDLISRSWAYSWWGALCLGLSIWFYLHGNDDDGPRRKRKRLLGSATARLRSFAPGFVPAPLTSD